MTSKTVMVYDSRLFVEKEVEEGLMVHLGRSTLNSMRRAYSHGQKTSAFHYFIARHPSQTSEMSDLPHVVSIAPRTLEELISRAVQAGCPRGRLMKEPKGTECVEIGSISTSNYGGEMPIYFGEIPVGR